MLRTPVRRPQLVGLIALPALLGGCGGKATTIIVTSPPATVTQPVIPQARVYRVPSGSMEPTISVGAHVLVQSRSPQVGDIVVFHPPRDAEQQVCGPTPHVVKLNGAACAHPEPWESNVTFIKRVVAGPGDEIYISEGHVFRKAAGSSTFVPQQDSYIKLCRSAQFCNFPTPITIPAGEWFMMGDNRGESDDSRFYGPVPTEWIEGVVTVNTPAGTPE